MTSIHPLKLLRALYGWSQRHLAATAGVSRNRLANAERGIVNEIRKHPEKDLSIARAVGLSLPEYLDLLDGKLAPSTAEKIAQKAAQEPNGQSMTADEVLQNFGG